jgi:nucleotide-binding universal stress UspA family protein
LVAAIVSDEATCKEIAVFDLMSKKILAPTDFSEQSTRSVDMALTMVTRPGQLTVLHVAPPLHSFAVADPGMTCEAVSDEERMNQLREALRIHFRDDKYREVHFEVVVGAPADEIAKYAERDQSELIVLPSHGRTGLARLMIGSVAERVVRLAHCPVLVLRD